MTDVVTKGLNEGRPSEIRNSQQMSTVDLEPNHKVSNYGRTIKPVNKLNLWLLTTVSTLADIICEQSEPCLSNTCRYSTITLQRSKHKHHSVRLCEPQSWIKLRFMCSGSFMCFSAQTIMAENNRAYLGKRLVNWLAKYYHYYSLHNLGHIIFNVITRQTQTLRILTTIRGCRSAIDS